MVMAGSSPVPTNLQDMIALIDAEKLQMEMFTIHAPLLSVSWDALPRKRRARAEKLADLLVAFMKREDGKTQGMALFRQISTIAIINADASNAASISDQIEKRVELKRRFDSFEWASVPKRGPAILAAFVNILAHRKITPSGDSMKDGHEENARRVANDVWRDLVASATSQLNNIRHTPRIDVSTPTIVGDAARTAGISDFCAEFKRLVREKRNQDKFYVAVAPLPSERHTRYLIKTSPLAGEVMAVNEEHTDAKLEPNRHVIALEILHDEVHNRICISKTNILSPRLILDTFMNLVLGCEQVVRPKRSYVQSLQVFRGKSGSRAITLPSANVKLGDRAWISSMSVSLDGNLLPTTYRGNEDQDIYDQMARQVDPSQFPEANRVVEEIVIKVKLHGAQSDGSGNQFATSEEKTFSVKVSDGTFTIFGKDNCFKREWLELLDKLKHDWGFDGMVVEDAELATEASEDLFTGI